MLHELASSLGRHLATIPSPGKWPGQVLSRYPILESRTFSHFTWDVPVPPLSRCAGAVRVQLCDAHRMWVFVLHLHPSDGEIRKVEADIVCQCVEQLLREEDEMVILGDFNCERDEPVHVRLASLGFLNAMEAVGGGLRPTVDTAGKKIKRAIDHIYVSPHLADRLIAARIVDTPASATTSRAAGAWDLRSPSGHRRSALGSNRLQRRQSMPKLQPSEQALRRLFLVPVDVQVQTRVPEHCEVMHSMKRSVKLPPSWRREGAVGLC